MASTSSATVDKLSHSWQPQQVVEFIETTFQDSVLASTGFDLDLDSLTKTGLLLIS